jgi:DNA-binding NtrC family response regulator
MTSTLPTPWRAADPSPLARIETVAAEGGVIAVDGPAREIAAAIAHLERRARLAGRPFHLVDGSIVDEPWIELARRLDLEVRRDAVAVARGLRRAATGRVVAVRELEPTRFGREIAETLAREPGGAFVVFGPRRSDMIARAVLEEVASPDDLDRFYGALVEAARDEALSATSLGALAGWWTARPDEMVATSAEVRTLGARLALARQSLTHAQAASLAPVGALEALLTTGSARREGRRITLSPAMAKTAEAWAEDGDARATAEVLATSRDPWSSIRAAELFVRAGDRARAHVAARDALETAADASARADLWRRFAAALDEGLDESERLAYAELALSRGDVDQAVRLAGPGSMTGSGPASPGGETTFQRAIIMGRAAAARGDVRTASRALERALSLAGDELERARAAVELAELRLAEGKREDAEARARRALNSGDPVLDLAARNALGKVAIAAGRWEAAEEHFTADEAEARRLDRPSDALRARLNRAIAVMSQGRLLEARALFESILETGEQLGDRRATALALANLGNFASLSHDYPRAIELVERATEELRVLGDAFRLARQIFNLADLRLRVGMVEEAEQALAFGRRACGPDLGDALVSLLSYVTAKARLCAGNTLGAAAAIEEAINAALRSSNGAKLGECHRLATRIALEDGDLPRARRHLARALEAATGPDATADQAVLEAMLARAAGEPHRTFAEQALDHCAEQPEHALQAHEICALAAYDEGDHDEAQRHLEAALALRDRLAGPLSEALRQRFFARRDLAGLSDLEARLSAPPTLVSAVRATPAAAPRQLIGDSPAMRALRAAIAKVGSSDATTLIAGESGTGKELVADALHRASRRHDGPLVKVNCGALVETLLLSELFGHEKGAFTGASSRKRGLFEKAHGGTIFLDEIGDISPGTQVALLRVLQERVFDRVGGTEPIEVDVRVVCATHRDLRALVQAGRFREDLYYRLSGVTLEVPALRDRLTDLPLLAAELLRRVAREQQGGEKRLSDDALALLAAHRWPGNVRELENALRVAALFAESETIERDDLEVHVEALRALAPPRSETRATADPGEAVYGAIRSGRSLPEMKKLLERLCIERALEEAGGNITHAADLLGMKRPRVSQLVNQFARDDEEVAS